mmetsp:Transcript_17169/g.24983  ORF Transcript_17169/g.24983 Transcript_17169/m.24983 type:complete len:109 (-) Transcript_17169:780-1106(-)
MPFMEDVSRRMNSLLEHRPNGRIAQTFLIRHYSTQHHRTYITKEEQVARTLLLFVTLSSMTEEQAWEDFLLPPSAMTNVALVAAVLFLLFTRLGSSIQATWQGKQGRR